MSANIDRARAGFDAWNRNDLDAWLELLDPEIEFRPAGVFPDFEPVYQGHEGLASFWRAIHEPWQELRAEIDYIEERADCVVVTVRFRATGHDEMRVDMPLTAAIRMRDGLAVEMVSRKTVEEAWQTLGGANSA